MAAKLWIGNIDPATTDAELREFLKRYGVDPIQSIARVEGDGTRPAAVVEIDAAGAVLANVTQRLNGLNWKGRALMVQAMTR